MDELIDLVNSEELRKASQTSSKRWLDNSIWKPITIEEYLSFLDDIQSLKKEMNAPDLPHPRMKGEKYAV